MGGSITVVALDEQISALLDAHGSWAIIRKGKRDKPPTVRKFKRRPHRAEEATARAAWSRLDVREGWALLVHPEGKTIARQSGPWGVRTRW